MHKPGESVGAQGVLFWSLACRMSHGCKLQKFRMCNMLEYEVLIGKSKRILRMQMGDIM